MGGIRQARRASKRARAGPPSVAKKPSDMTNRVIAFVCLLGLSGALAQAEFDYKQPSDYYRDIQQGLEFIQSRSGQASGGHGGYGGYSDPTSLLPGVFPSVFLGGLGLLGAPTCPRDSTPSTTTTRSASTSSSGRWR